jgi:hypothetical protein
MVIEKSYMFLLRKTSFIRLRISSLCNVECMAIAVHFPVDALLKYEAVWWLFYTAETCSHLDHHTEVLCVDRLLYWCTCIHAEGIWYDIFINCSWVATRWQKFSIHLHTNNTQNDTKQTIHRTTQKFRKSAGRAQSLRALPWHLPYNWGKSTEKPQSG